MSKTSLSLDPAIPLTDSIPALIDSELANALAALTSGNPPEDKAVYAARKTIKRLRSIVRLARPGLGTEQFRLWNADLRDLGRLLAGSRDRAALVETAMELASRATGPDMPSRASATRMIRLTHEHGLTLAGAADTADAARQGAETLASLRERGFTWRKMSGKRLLTRSLSTTHGRGRLLLDQAFATDDPEALHEARKRVVHLRYQLEALTRAWPKYLKAWVRELQALREHMGDFNDLANLEAALADPASPLYRTPRRDDWLTLSAARRADLKHEARALADRLFAERTDAFTERMVGYWEVARREDRPNAITALDADEALLAQPLDLSRSQVFEIG